MNTEQKLAWFTIGVCTAALAASGLLYWYFGFPVAMAGFSLLALTGFNPVLFSSLKRKQQIEYDERDRIILRKANVAGGMVSYLIFVLNCMGVWFVQYASGEAEIAIGILPVIVCAGGIGLLMVRSVAVLVLYREGGSYAEG